MSSFASPLVGVTMAIAALTSAACGGPSGAASPAAARPCHVAEAIATVTTATYTMSLATGPPERMYSPSEVAATHPTDGEVMLGGTMTGGDGGHDMAAMGDPGGAGASAGAGGGGALRHVEIHICSRTTGRVIADALPTLVARDPRTGMTVYLPVAVMQGVTAGPNDLHYGNNVEIPPGHELTLTVTLSGEEARFLLR